jgi:dihydrofolate reductase
MNVNIEVLTTAQTLAPMGNYQLGLIDEYVLMVHPIGLGEGKHLFTDRMKLELLSVKPYKSGVVQMRYRPRM